MGKVLFTADMHFGHENAIAFDKRPFASVDEMDEELIRRWNTLSICIKYSSKGKQDVK